MTDASHPEAALVARVQRGDTEAFSMLVRAHSERAFRVAYRLLGQREDAEDLVQDVFLVALERIDQCRPGHPFAPWFYRILTNRGLNARKARAIRSTRPLPEEIRASGESPEQEAEQAEVRERLRAALEALPERQRQIVRLFELEGFSGTEIAGILEISDGTVRWHLHHARKLLREVLAPLAGNP